MSDYFIILLSPLFFPFLVPPFGQERGKGEGTYHVS